MSTIHMDDLGRKTRKSAHCLDRSGFVSLADVIPDAILDIRYYSAFNFVGTRIDAYQAPVAYLTKEAAIALKRACEQFKAQGYLIKVFDTYRPQSAVNHFKRWEQDMNATEMKAYFYPDLEKSALFASGYISERSSHSRGAAVDLTLVDIKSGLELDMGSAFDFFGQVSHSMHTEGLTDAQIRNRSILRNVMIEHGFKPIVTEWWHFTLQNEPYPDTYFDFPVTAE